MSAQSPLDRTVAERAPPTPAPLHPLVLAVVALTDRLSRFC